MKFDAVSLLIFLISLALVVASVFSLYRPLPYVTGHAFEFVMAGYVILALGLLLRGR